MNALAHPLVARPMQPLKAWRKRQRVWDAAKRRLRPMVITDVPGKWGIPWQTWHAWEQWPDHKDFNEPSPENKRRLFEITRGEITPDCFYPIDEWREQMPASVAAEAQEHSGGG